MDADKIVTRRKSMIKVTWLDGKEHEVVREFFELAQSQQAKATFILLLTLCSWCLCGEISCRHQLP
jgi:hypothetical protein